MTTLGGPPRPRLSLEDAGTLLETVNSRIELQFAPREAVQQRPDRRRLVVGRYIGHMSRYILMIRELAALAALEGPEEGQEGRPEPDATIDPRAMSDAAFERTRYGPSHEFDRRDPYRSAAPEPSWDTPQERAAGEAALRLVSDTFTAALTEWEQAQAQTALVD